MYLQFRKTLFSRSLQDAGIVWPLLHNAPPYKQRFVSLRDNRRGPQSACV